MSNQSIQKRNELKEIRNTRVGKKTHGQTGSKTYYAWCSAKKRCFSPSNSNYSRYGARGITMCDEWVNSFDSFFRDMGECPKGMTLERIDTNGNYAPENCRWATNKEQQRNKRTSLKLTFNGETLSVWDWAEKLGWSIHAIKHRIRNGWPVDKILTLQPKSRT